jgi:hypothetical protein
MSPPLILTDVYRRALQTELSGGFSLSTIQKVTAVVCYGLQVIAECLITGTFSSFSLLIMGGTSAIFT